ncbi:MAG: DUF11 domain-containing protein [Chloroflexi bacterium]|nr:DUF11 domain-containing protein [Chloroflexota bacterium]
MIRRLARSQAGMAMIMLLGFMVLAVPLVTVALQYASTLSMDSRVKTRLVKSSYATLGGNQYALYRLQYEAGYADSLPLGIPVSSVITLNDIPVTVTVTKESNPPPPPQVPGGLTNRSFSISKSVFPATASPGADTTYVYQALLSNMTPNTKTVNSIQDDFPTGLSYVTGSTSGITTSNPTLVSGDLKWSLTDAEKTLDPFSTKLLQFSMRGTLAQGVYCNDVWVAPGGDKTRSGLTAKIVVGSPASTLCPGTAITLTKSVSPSVVPSNQPNTFTYTITFTSTGTASVAVSKIVDLMPAGFNYVTGSSTGLTTANPAIVLKNGNQQQLTWSANPIGTVAPGGTATLSFQATATVASNDYWNEVSATVSGLNYDLYSWPTARVQVMGVFQITAEDDKSTAESTAWLGSESIVVDEFTFSSG